ncbi:hypothetical protein KJ632_04520, partial [Patescibacteria group bacterium]|nr:hypothetical protein [Patescibacteria group bacterium]
MTPQKFAKNILKKIRDQHISPRPRWEFLLKDYTMWVAFGLCVIIGGIASSVTIFRLINSDWDVYERTGHSFASFAFESMPYFWILLFALFVVIAYLNFTHTKKGYK